MLDVAIIGGGVAGCYCAYRLAESGDVALFEASSRIGGRLWSAPVPGCDMPAEIGGMYVRDNHRNTRALIDHLGLALAPAAFKRAGQFVRGVHFDDGDFAAEHLPFALAPSERKSSPAQLLMHAIESMVPGSTDLWPVNRRSLGSAQATFDRLREVRHDGRGLHEWSLWNLLAEVVSNEAYALLTSTLGSVSLFRNINAFDGVWNLLHEVGDGAAYRLSDGYQALPLALRKRAEARGVEFHLSHRLRSVAPIQGGFELLFETDDGACVRMVAHRVILALPRRALQLVDLSSALDSEFERLRDQAVLPMRSCKIFLVYDQAWWGAGESQGSVSARYTDLPMQQCYQWSSASEDAPVLLMAAYADDSAASFWTPLTAASLSRFESAAGRREDAQSLGASVALVASARRQLAKTHNREDTPPPRGALYFDWGADPYGAAWHGWAPHIKSWEIRQRLRQPNPHLDLFICGEAYAQRNGWVEGAVNSAERTLERLGLPRPGWITDPGFQFEIDDRGEENDDSDDTHVQCAEPGHGVAA